MEYERRKKNVQAIQLSDSIFNADGKSVGGKGDWLVIENGQQYYMTNKEFTDEFQPKATNLVGSWTNSYMQEQQKQPVIGDIRWQVPHNILISNYESRAL